MKSNLSQAELLERRLNNAALLTGHGEYEEAFCLYMQIADTWPEEAQCWRSWLDCCYRWISSTRSVFFKEDAYDVRLMREIFERVLSFCDETEAAEQKARWDSFWNDVADAARAGAHSLFHVAPNPYACSLPLELFAQELSLLGELHPRLAEVIAEGLQLADALTKEGVCFWQVEHLTVKIQEGIWNMEQPKPAASHLKGTCFDWFPLRPEFHTKLVFVLGNMCLHRRDDPNGQTETTAILVFLARTIPMEDIKPLEFKRYALWRWNAAKYCPYCGAKLVGLFTRECIGCHGDVKKIKNR